ncbi:glycosyltransferase family 2 protein [Neobacillus sp. NPDC097160]|uniref:glycosyltransferase family 2 protein n=1 Tax=Neobacillus sp. NPDC097160 TaxID=3364298 RepID=UPI003805A845
MKKVLVIIPAYNEEEAIYSTVSKLKSSSEFDYVVINDGSTDGTKAILDQFNLNYLDLPINLGIGGAMQTGYKFALRNNYDFAIQLDADGQHDPTEISHLISEIQGSAYDMIIGSRFVEESSYKGSKTRRIGIYYFYYLLRILTGIKVTDPTSGYRIVNRKIINEFAKRYPVDYPEVEVIVDLTKKKYKIKEVKVEMKNRQGGVSSITPIKSIYYMFKVSFFSLIRRVF